MNTCWILVPTNIVCNNVVEQALHFKCVSFCPIFVDKNCFVWPLVQLGWKLLIIVSKFVLVTNLFID